MRLIDADVLIDFIDVGHFRSPSEICFSEFDVVDMLEDCATVDAVEVVHGHWIWGEVLLNRQTCFCCKAHFDCLEIDNYCPNCGAKMDEVSE